MKYSIDTSAIMDGWVRNYPPDVFPGLWQHIDSLIDGGHLRATEEVLRELKRQSDELYRWARARETLFIPLDESIQMKVAEILRSHPKLIDQRRNRSGADPFVIALAAVNRCSVVSGELPTKSERRPHIPDVCAARGIECITLLSLLRREGWSFRPD